MPLLHHEGQTRPGPRGSRRLAENGAGWKPDAGWTPQGGRGSGGGGSGQLAAGLSGYLGEKRFFQRKPKSSCVGSPKISGQTRKKNLSKMPFLPFLTPFPKIAPKLLCTQNSWSAHVPNFFFPEEPGGQKGGSWTEACLIEAAERAHHN